ncbi:hypothetical protein diail_6659 [Diaporthe ilicicola]|nr:hypothetical protein diail_6659 [Diaporthe ilicicola]
MSQAQRYGDVYDGIVAGAPAFHHAQQQVNHLTTSVSEVVMEYFPPPCEMSKIANATIAACDTLDGRTDGVVARTDLCLLNFNLTSIIGESYYCAAATSSSLGSGFSKRAEGSTTRTTAEQNGTVTAEGVALAQKLYSGLTLSTGEQVYLPWQIASSFDDAATTYDNTTASWGVTIPSTGGVFVANLLSFSTRITWLASTVSLTRRFTSGKREDLIFSQNKSMIAFYSLFHVQICGNNLLITARMHIGYLRYYDSLQTGYTDLSGFNNNVGKLLHYHGESDPSIPPPSSVRYHEAVREAMYPNSGFNQSVSALSDWYQFYLVPGAAHCGANSLQPGPYPANNMDTMISWVEQGVTPTRLKTTVSSGDYSGEVPQLC